MLFFSLHFYTVLHCHIFARCKRSVAQLWWTCVFLAFRVSKMKYDSKRRDSTEEWKKTKKNREVWVKSCKKTLYAYATWSKRFLFFASFLQLLKLQPSCLDYFFTWKVTTLLINLFYHFKGRITSVSNGPGGQKLYDGVHTKGEADNKWITYSGYNFYFTGMELSKLRISPNVLDILSDNDSGSAVDGLIRPCDIFISYSKVNISFSLYDKLNFTRILIRSYWWSVEVQTSQFYHFASLLNQMHSMLLFAQ